MISLDLPIKKASEDVLERKSFAENLAKTISEYSYPSSFTIGLHGEWGSGKTSLLNMVIEAVGNKDDNIVIVRFNPWLCTDTKQLITQFLKQTASAIKMKTSSKQKVWEIIDNYADMLDVAGNVPGPGPAIAAVGKLLTIIAKSKKTANDLQQTKDQIIDKMKKEEIRIVVTIDDIDRLSEDEIVAVFQLVKSIGDFPNTVYLLAFDYDVVVRALGKVQHGDGKEYLEKIIQVPVEIPAPNIENIYDALLSKLNGILEDVPQERWDKTTWAELFEYGVKKYIRSIRDVARYTNVFLLKYELLKEETDPVDLIGVTLLQVFEPFVYSKLWLHKDVLCGVSLEYSYEKKEEEIKRMLSLLLPDDGTVKDQEATQNILTILFPKISKHTAFSFGLGRTFVHRDFLINKNISSPECFERYFALTLEKEAIPTNLIKHLIYEATAEEFEESLLWLYREGKIERCCEEIEAHAKSKHAETLSEERACLIIVVLSHNWHSFDVDDSGLFSVPFSWRLLNCIEPLLNIMEEEKRFAFLSKVFDDQNVAPATLAIILSAFERKLDRFVEKPSDVNVEEAPLSLERVLELEKIFQKRCNEAINSGIALRQRNGLNFLWLLGKINAKLVDNIEKNLVTDDMSLTKVISYCSSRGTITARTVNKVFYVNRERLALFIDIEDAYKRIKLFLETPQFLTLSREDQINSVAFILLMECSEPDFELDRGISEDVINKRLEQLKIRNTQAKPKMSEAND